MKTHFFPICALPAALLALLLLPGSRADAQTHSLPTLQLVETYDLPTTSGEPNSISSRGDTTGSAVHSGLNYSYARSRSGAISTFHFGDLSTNATGINRSRTICGTYVDSHSDFYGFLFAGGVFTPYEPPADYQRRSFLSDINDAGDLTGTVYDATGQTVLFLTRNGIFTPIDLGLADTFSMTNAISSDGRVAGTYEQAPEYQPFGFTRQADGTILTGIHDPAADVYTSCAGINDRGWVVGFYTTGAIYHGFLFIPPSKFINYDVPGGTSTSFTGINDRGQICGFYSPSDGSSTRGLLVQVVE